MEKIPRPRGHNMVDFIRNRYFELLQQMSFTKPNDDKIKKIITEELTKEIENGKFKTKRNPKNIVSWYVSNYIRAKIRPKQQTNEV